MKDLNMGHLLMILGIGAIGWYVYNQMQQAKANAALNAQLASTQQSATSQALNFITGGM